MSENFDNSPNHDRELEKFQKMPDHDEVVQNSVDKLEAEERERTEKSNEDFNFARSQERLKATIRGETGDLKESATENNETPNKDEKDDEPKLGLNTLSPDTLGEIARINSLPVNERADEVAKLKGKVAGEFRKWGGPGRHGKSYEFPDQGISIPYSEDDM